MSSRAGAHMGFIRGAPSRGFVGAVMVVLAVASLLCFGAGCGVFPFEVRESEDPGGRSAVSVVPATEPTAVLSNLAVAFKNQAADPFNEQITEDFVFVADQIDVAELEQTYPGIFDDWTFDVEERVTQYVLDSGRCTWARLTITNDEVLEQPTDTTYSTQMDYHIALTLNGDAQTYTGQGRLFMRKTSDNLWHIYRWEDIRPEDAEHDTWGILRGRIRATI